MALREGVADRLPPSWRQRIRVPTGAALVVVLLALVLFVGVSAQLFLSDSSRPVRAAAFGSAQSTGTTEPGEQTDPPAGSPDITPSGDTGPGTGIGTGTRVTTPLTGDGVLPGAAASSPAAQVVVAVVGRVRRPGVLRLPAGSRVTDALSAAGGATAGADLRQINLARLLLDGEQILVPAPGDRSPVQLSPGAPGSPDTSGAAGSINGANRGGATGPIDLNAATETDLDTLPGVGPVIAGRILRWRQEHGRFTSVDELLEVSGIGEKVLANLRPLVTV